MLIDTCICTAIPALLDDPEGFMDEAAEETAVEVGIIQAPGEKAREVLALAEESPRIFFTATDPALVSHAKCVGVGPVRSDDPALGNHIALGEKEGLPLVVDGSAPITEEQAGALPAKGLVSGYAGDPGYLPLVEKGYLFAIGPAVLEENPSLEEALKAIPQNQLAFESRDDCNEELPFQKIHPVVERTSEITFRSEQTLATESFRSVRGVFRKI